MNLAGQYLQIHPVHGQHARELLRYTSQPDYRIPRPGLRRHLLLLPASRLKIPTLRAQPGKGPGGRPRRARLRRENPCLTGDLCHPDPLPLAELDPGNITTPTTRVNGGDHRGSRLLAAVEIDNLVSGRGQAKQGARKGLRKPQACEDCVASVARIWSGRVAADLQFRSSTAKKLTNARATSSGASSMTKCPAPAIFFNEESGNLSRKRSPWA